MQTPPQTTPPQTTPRPTTPPPTTPPPSTPPPSTPPPSVVGPPVASGAMVTVLPPPVPTPASGVAGPGVPTGPVATAPGASVSDQLVTVLTPLRTGAGAHLVTLGLQPEGLGSVQATVSVSSQQMVVSLWADSATGHAALAGSLPQLHSQLTADASHRVVVELAALGSARPDAGGGDPRGDGRPDGRRLLRTSAIGAVDHAPSLLVGAAAVPGLGTIDLHL